jgi:hypothetical protein
MTRALALFALLQGLLYCSLLPLWEGYDEPYHYGYALYLASEREFPVVDRTPLQDEVWRSMFAAPASHMNAGLLPGMISYRSYFEMEPAARRAMRGRLYSGQALPEVGRPAPHNYEAQQPPVAYLPLAAIEWAIPGGALPWRAYRLRLFCAFLSLALVVYASLQLGELMGLRRAYLGAAVFLLLATQNLYGAIAHVANDWLSVALIPLLFLAAERFRQRPAVREAVVFALTLAAGLLTKSYFLVFVPFAVLLVLWVGRKQIWVFAGLVAAAAGPWYLRNVLLYDSLSGLQASVRAIPHADVMRVFWSVRWSPALLGLARSALWNSNSSFGIFSQTTLNVLLLLLTAGAALWLRGALRKQATPAAWLVVAGCAVFSVIPIYVMVLFGTVFKGIVTNANSWHSAGLLPGVFLLAMSGFSQGGRPGRWLARGTIAAGVYVLVLTYFAKLIPLYAGFEGRANLRFLSSLYFAQPAAVMARLGETAMLSGGVVVILALATTVCGVVLGCRLARALD